jgi:hypothetical protein
MSCGAASLTNPRVSRSFFSDGGCGNLFDPLGDLAGERWSSFLAHNDVPRLIALLRDDHISNQDRHEFHEELIAATEDVFGEDVDWRQETE